MTQAATPYQLTQEGIREALGVIERLSIALRPARPQSPAKLLDQVIRNNGNGYSTARAYALDALTDNRAAFWIAREGDNNQIANCVMKTACRLGTLAVALEEEVPSYHRRNFPNAVETVLDLLIPLNSAAVVQLGDSYEDAGTFRDRAELIARRDRVSPLPAVA